MGRYEFYKEAYYQELSRKDVLEDALNIPLGIISAVIAALYYFFSSYDYHLEGGLEFVLKILFLVLMTGSVLFILSAIYFLAQSYNNGLKGHPYKYVDKFEDINTYYNNLKNYHAQNQTPNQLQSDFEDFLGENFMIAVTNNVFQNQTKTAYLHKAKVNLVRSIIVIGLAAVFFGCNYYEKDNSEPVHKVQIMNAK